MRIIIYFFTFISYVAFGQSPQKNCPPRDVCANYGPTNKLNGRGSQELNSTNQGCLDVENNSDWIVLTVQTSGTITFTITPNSSGDDFDFAVWGPNPNCPPTTAPIRCSWASYFGSGIQTTGINSANNSPENDNTESFGGNFWVQDLNVTVGEQYIVLIDDYTSKGKYSMSFGGTASIICMVLPIEIISFYGVPTKDKNRIYWETATETNNSFFVLEKSNDAYNFEEITRINGAGNSQWNIQYECEDSRRIKGIKYYRLKQVDYNGNYTYSNIIVVENNSEEIKLLRRFSLLGQQIPITEETQGFYFEYYSDGSLIKKIR